jgi:tetratricopeptide (TPR) repeat protein
MPPGDPESGTYWFEKGSLEVMEGALGDAYDSYHRMMEINPEFVQGWVALAQVCFTLKKFDEAIEHAQKVLYLYAGDDRDVSLDALDLLRKAHLERGEIDKSFDYLERLYEVNPANEEALQVILGLNMRMNENQKVIHFADLGLGAIETPGTRARLYLAKAIALTELQQPGSAIEVLEQASSDGIKSKNFEAVLARARELLANGNHE